MPVRTLLNAGDRASLIERSRRVQAQMPPRWGRMDAAQMMRHCAEALGASLGDIRHRPLGKRLFHARFVKFVIIRLLPFPKGAPTAPELRITGSASLETERARVCELLARYGLPAGSDGQAEHPLFGVLTRAEWAELKYKHVDHHLRQFGV